MSELKTQKNNASVLDFIKAVPDEKKRAESLIIHNIMEEETGEKGAMWGDSIVGYGSYHYKSISGREGDWMLTGFSPRKQKFSLYIMTGFKGYENLMKKLGKHKTGVSCLYVNKLDDIDLVVLRKLVRDSVDHMRKMNP